MTTKGIVYIALGVEYLEMATNSILSIVENYSKTEHLPNFKVFTDVDTSSIPRIDQIPSFFQYINPVEYPDNGVATAYIKTILYHLSPFDITLYLDCDTKIVGDISKIWSYCGNRIAVSRAFNPIKEDTIYSDSECIKTQQQLSVIGDFTQYNTGVFLFKKSPNTKSIFRAWNDEWELFKNHENMAFNRLVAQGMGVDYLLPVYNDFYPNRCPQSVLVHYIAHYKKYLND